jgi:thymidylate synthase
LNLAVKGIFDFSFDDIRIENYQPHPPLRGAIAV